MLHENTAKKKRNIAQAAMKGNMLMHFGRQRGSQGPLKGGCGNQRGENK